MKIRKIIKLLCCISFPCCISFSSCDPPLPHYDKCIWRIENNTNKSIIFNIVVGQNIEPIHIAAGEFTTIQTKYFLIEDGEPFGDVLENKDSIIIMLNDQVKKTWRKTDSDKSGRHFYNQSSWSFDRTRRKTHSENYIFTFTIEDEDLN